ncbi:transcriptional regulator/arsenate reductase [Edwardsiella tarda]|uniref:transcriptional regulator/arsenate reductase n=1 Tax=Edwardsiella tarda TaxID=636 RepID=UPI002443ABC1|nr:transcriptional regulator/arsenate reductase [Edwardsiella tarda]WGE27716.1 transcriptional regulator/arsenate reductase [Edwardsiella tarda]
MRADQSLVIFAEPATSEGSEAQQLHEFCRIYNEIGNWSRIFMSLPQNKLDRLSPLRELNNIGLMQTAVITIQGEQ